MNAPEWLQNAFEVISLVWTWPVLILGIGVVLHWSPSVYRMLTTRKDMEGYDWLVLGVTVSFFGMVIDNAWWGIAWTVDYLQWSCKDWWFRHGVYSNVFFRQLAGAYAAYCHMRAFYCEQRPGNKVNYWMSISLAVGVLYGAVLSIVKNLKW